MKSFLIKITQQRDAYVTIEAENEADARDRVRDIDEETLEWEEHNYEIESVDEQEAD